MLTCYALLKNPDHRVLPAPEIRYPGAPLLLRDILMGDAMREEISVQKDGM